MLAKHNSMLVDLLSKLHPSGSLATNDLLSLTKVHEMAVSMCCSFFTSGCVIHDQSLSFTVL
jgi:hypothetical protein